MGAQGHIELLIIADDLTGSNDAGAQFAKRGIPSVVLVDYSVAELPRGYSVVVVNTESRHESATEAARRVTQVARLGLESGVRHFFKKTDSTLRGNIGAELKALLKTTGERSLPFVPAFPEMGRTTRLGIHYVHGVPIAESAFSKDPLSPVRESKITKILCRNAGLHAVSVSLGNLPDAPEADCLVLDCETRADLRRIATECRRRDALRVLSGSAAFAEELPEMLSLCSSAKSAVEARRPILFVNGSLNPRALEQVAAAEGVFHKVRLTPDLLLTGKMAESQFMTPMGVDVLLHSVEQRSEYPIYQREAAKLGIQEADLHSAVSHANGQIVRALLKTGGFRTLVVFGGDTLMGIAREMCWATFVPSGEIEPGVTVATPEGSEVVVISKAGGFGDREVVGRILRRIGTADVPSRES